MNLFDEKQPEEQDPQYEELITHLQKAHFDPRLVDPQERAHILSQARARLFPADPEVFKPTHMVAPALREHGNFPGKPTTLADNKHRYRRLLHFINMLAAVLVVILLIGSAVLIFGPWSPLQQDRSETAPPIGPVGAPVTINTQAGGLEVSLRITGGRYFLSELLAVNLSITNHSHTTFLLGLANDSCPGPLKVTMTGGENQNGTNLESNQATMLSCNAGAGAQQLFPGQTFSNSQYIALIRSGHVTLTIQATFLKSALQDGVVQLVPTTDPLDGHWPSLQMIVQKQTPSDRSIALHQQGSQVSITALPVALHQLLYISVYDCDVGRGSSQHEGTDLWSKLSTMTLQKPVCGVSSINGTPTPRKLLRWMYAVGAPGYAIISGEYPS